MTAPFRIAGIFAAASLFALCHSPAGAQSAAQPSAVPAATAASELIEGALADGTHWAVRKPAQWNGTIVLDLDGASVAQPPRSGMGAQHTDWLIAQGFAVGGTTREPVGYDFPKAVDNLLEVRRLAAAKWGPARRTLVAGGSRGGFVVRKALELHPEAFAGGVTWSGGGAGEIAVLNNKLNALFVLKTLVDPASEMPLVNITLPQDNQRLGQLVEKARATPQGRARLALAAGVEQFAPWSSRTKPKPAPDDYEAQIDQIGESFVFATALPVRAGVEKAAGGNVSWNTSVDYAALLRKSGRQAMVEALYRKAGLSLTDDLARLAREPRISASPAAVRKAEPLMTYTGRIKAPLVNVDNDDPVDPASDKLAYAGTLRRAGTLGLFRMLWVDGPGHGGQTALDRTTGFSVLLERLKTGKWPATDVASLNARAARLASEAQLNLGKPTFFAPPMLPAPANSWDIANWGKYRN